jgi:hypothetical protein
MKSKRITMTLSLALACTLAGCASTDEQIRRDDILYQGRGGVTRAQLIAVLSALSTLPIGSTSLTDSPTEL